MSPSRASTEDSVDHAYLQRMRLINHLPSSAFVPLDYMDQEEPLHGRPTSRTLQQRDVNRSSDREVADKPAKKRAKISKDAQASHMSREYESLVENQETLATWSLGPGPESAVAFPGHHDSHHDSQFADAEEMDVPGIHLTDQPDMEDEYREIRNDMMTEDHGGICRTIIFEAVEEETDDEFLPATYDLEQSERPFQLLPPQGNTTVRERYPAPIAHSPPSVPPPVKAGEPCDNCGYRVPIPPSPAKPARKILTPKEFKATYGVPDVDRLPTSSPIPPSSPIPSPAVSPMRQSNPQSSARSVTGARVVEPEEMEGAGWMTQRNVWVVDGHGGYRTMTGKRIRPKAGTE